jgi:hypothetical protein
MRRLYDEASQVQASTRDKAVLIQIVQSHYTAIQAKNKTGIGDFEAEEILKINPTVLGTH